MDSIDYFIKLHDWNDKFYRAALHTKSRRISEYWNVVDVAMFSQIEKNLILSNK